MPLLHSRLARAAASALPFAQAKQRFRIDQKAQRLGEREDFSKKFREGL